MVDQRCQSWSHSSKWSVVIHTLIFIFIIIITYYQYTYIKIYFANYTKNMLNKLYLIIVMLPFFFLFIFIFVAFYGDDNKHLASNYVRFAFCKPDEMIDEAAKRLLQVNQ